MIPFVYKYIMQIPSNFIFNKQNTIFSQHIIPMKVARANCSIYGGYFYYIYGKPYFKYSSHYNDDSEKNEQYYKTFLDIIQEANYIYTIVNKVDYHIIKVSTNDPIKFIHDIQNIMENKENLNEYPGFYKHEIIYESEDFCKNITYDNDFIKNNIRQLLHNNYYCTIDAFGKKENGEYIDVSFSAYSRIFCGNIFDKDVCKTIVKFFPKKKDFLNGSFRFSSGKKYEIELIDELFKVLAIYFSNFRIKYIYVGYNEFSPDY